MQNPTLETHTQQKIIEYYQKCEVAYRDVWDLDHSLAIHYGYWDKNTKNLRQSLRQMNEKLAQMIKISPQSHLLDAGCGVGGSAIFLAQNYDCQVTGITICPTQVEKATQNAQKHQIAHQTQFALADYTQTHFPTESFDIIWAVESVCHANSKADFLQEAYRLLKKGGQIIIADGFENQPNYTPKERAILAKWAEGWAIPHLPQKQIFEQEAQKIGFQNTNYQDFTPYIYPSSKRLFWYAQAALSYGKLRQLIGKKYGNQHTIQNTIGAKYQFKALKKQLWQYLVFTAQK